MGRKKKNEMEEPQKIQKRKLDTGVILQNVPGGVFLYRYQVNGCRKAVSLGTKDIDEAEKIARTRYLPIVSSTSEEVVAAHVAVARKLREESRNLFLCDAWDTYSRHPDRANPATVAEAMKYEGTLRQFTEVVNQPTITVAEITHEHAEKFSDFLRNLELSADTHNRKIKQLRRIFKVLSDYRTGDNPFMSPSLLRKAREDQHISTRRLSFTREQEMNIIAELKNPNRRLRNKDEIRIVYLIGMYTGQRLKDCVLLRWSQIDTRQNMVEVTQYKTGKTVQLPIARPLADGLAEARNWQLPQNDYVCPMVAARYVLKNDKGKEIGSGLVNNDVLRPIHWIGLETSVKVPERKKPITVYGFHSLRHSFVSFCAEAGVPKSVVQSFTGTDAEIVDHYYTHVGNEQQIKALDAVVSSIGHLSPEDRIGRTLAYIDALPEESLTGTVREIRRLLSQKTLSDEPQP